MVIIIQTSLFLKPRSLHITAYWTISLLPYLYFILANNIFVLLNSCVELSNLSLAVRKLNKYDRIRNRNTVEPQASDQPEYENLLVAYDNIIMDFKIQRRKSKENVALKVNLRSFSLYRYYSYLLTLSNVREPP